MGLSIQEFTVCRFKSDLFTRRYSWYIQLVRFWYFILFSFNKDMPNRNNGPLLMGLHIIKVVSNSSGILGQILIYITHDNFFHDNFPMTSKTLKTRNAISPSLSTILTSSSFDKFSKALQGTPRKNLKTRDSH